MYLDSARFNKPGTIPLTFQTEVNTGCNLDCPICFADSGHHSDGYSITAEQCARMLDVFVESEGEAEVVMFSGGEPTIHKQILDFIDMALQRRRRADEDLCRR